MAFLWFLPMSSTHRRLENVWDIHSSCFLLVLLSRYLIVLCLVPCSLVYSTIKYLDCLTVGTCHAFKSTVSLRWPFCYSSSSQQPLLVELMFHSFLLVALALLTPPQIVSSKTLLNSAFSSESFVSCRTLTGRPGITPVNVSGSNFHFYTASTLLLES